MFIFEYEYMLCGSLYAHHLAYLILFICSLSFPSEELLSFPLLGETEAQKR